MHQGATTSSSRLCRMDAQNVDRSSSAAVVVGADEREVAAEARPVGQRVVERLEERRDDEDRVDHQRHEQEPADEAVLVEGAVTPVVAHLLRCEAGRQEERENKWSRSAACRPPASLPDPDSGGLGHCPDVVRHSAPLHTHQSTDGSLATRACCALSPSALVLLDGVVLGHLVGRLLTALHGLGRLDVARHHSKRWRRRSCPCAAPGTSRGDAGRPCCPPPAQTSCAEARPDCRSSPSDAAVDTGERRRPAW